MAGGLRADERDQLAVQVRGLYSVLAHVQTLVWFRVRGLGDGY